MGIRPRVVSLVSLAVCLSGTRAQSAPPICGPFWDPTIGSPGLIYNTTSSRVNALESFDFGNGPRVVAGGLFSTANGIPAMGVAQWDGFQWSPVGTQNLNGTLSLAKYDNGTGLRLYSGTGFISAISDLGVFQWTGFFWSNISSGLSFGGNGPGESVYAMEVYDWGSGPRLVVGGLIDRNANPLDSSGNVAMWNGAAWEGLGFNTDGQVNALHVATIAGETALHVGGWFSSPANSVLKWNGTQWAALGSGIPAGPFASGRVFALTSFDDGSGEALYVGGFFFSAGGIPVNNIARWDGSQWSDVGGGTNGFVYSLAVFDDGTGPALFAGGSFTLAGGLEANLVAKWNGTAWAALPHALPQGNSGATRVIALGALDIGSLDDPSLYVGGEFWSTSCFESRSVARWRSQGESHRIIIGTAPEGATICEGETASFDVGACGPGPLTYQWRFNGQDIAGAVNDVLVIPLVAPADAGSYEVVVSNDCGTVTSDAAELTVTSASTCSLSDLPQRHPGGFDSNRYLRVVIDNPSCCVTALRVRMVDLQTPDPVNFPCCPAPDFSAYESGPTCTDPLGCARWVGPPRSYLEVQDIPSFGTFKAARLQCTPYYHAWGQEGQVSVLGAEIVPSSEYEIEALSVACAGNEENCTFVSAPLTIRTARFGDIATPRNPPAPTPQPDALDIVLLLNKFKADVDAESNTIVQMQPNVPNPNMDVSGIDIGLCIDAFKGKAYPYSGPCPCPSTVTCGTTVCTTATQCSFLEVGATCVKTCVGGPDDGQSCTSNQNCRRCVGGTAAGRNCSSNGNCPGGLCDLTPVCSTTGFCRDRCERCSPP